MGSSGNAKGARLKRNALFFTAPGQVEVREEQLDPPAEGQVLVRALLSAISPGTEMLVFRGHFPADLEIDENIAALAGSFRYPFKYGYSSVGEVAAVGPLVDPAWIGRCVFTFNPHQTYSVAAVEDLLPLPGDLDPLEAVFLPNMETAVNFVMDGRPLIGETVGVFGLGIVGLLTSALLAAFPLSGLAAMDRYARRREAALSRGVGLVLDPFEADTPAAVRGWLAQHGSPDGFDLVYELSGAPEALDQALSLTGFTGRVVLGSWYGTKRASLDLGGRFHRSRIQLLASQVSSLAPELRGRWDKTRRMDVAWERVKRIRPSRWITQRFPFDRAREAYRLIANHPEETIQVVLDYREGSE